MESAQLLPQVKQIGGVLSGIFKPLKIFFILFYIILLILSNILF